MDSTATAPLSLRERVRGWLSHDTHPAVQFVKYAIAGGVATAIDQAVSFVLSWLVLPALKSDELLVKILHLSVVPIDASTRSWHFAVNNAISFAIANTAAYALNVAFVFKPGKHDRVKEFLLFFAVSGVAALIGIASGAGVMWAFNLSFVVSAVTKILASLMINYAGRKYFIFKG